MKSVKLTERALDDIDEIEQYSINKWGNKVADKYLDDIESGLNLIQENSGLLQDFDEFSGRLKHYRIKSYFLICTEAKETIFVLTIKHVSMDIVTLLNKLEPTLATEVEYLSRR